MLAFVTNSKGSFQSLTIVGDKISLFISNRKRIQEGTWALVAEVDYFLLHTCSFQSLTIGESMPCRAQVGGENLV